MFSSHRARRWISSSAGRALGASVKAPAAGAAATCGPRRHHNSWPRRAGAAEVGVLMAEALEPTARPAKRASITWAAAAALAARVAPAAAAGPTPLAAEVAAAGLPTAALAVAALPHNPASAATASLFSPGAPG